MLKQQTRDAGAALRKIAGRGRRTVRGQRERVATARLYAERNVLARRRLGGERDTGRVLCYHSVGQPSMGVNDVDPDRFRRQLHWALEAGFRFVPASTIARTGGEPDELAVTFDDAPVTVATNAAPILQSLDIPFTVFVVSSWADRAEPGPTERYMDWDALARLSADGAEIGSHSVLHRRFPRLTEHRMREELVESRVRIRDRIGVDATSFAIPFGQSNDWNATAMACANDAGYEAIYAQAERTRPPGTIARTFVTRFDDQRVFLGALGGAFDSWEEWY